MIDYNFWSESRITRDFPSESYKVSLLQESKNASKGLFFEMKC